jgi:membrane protein YqaA with SNARE-associated domain
MAWMRRLYDWVIHWASTPKAVPALFLIAFAESSFFPIPPDVLLIAMVLSVPTRAFRYAFICSLGSVLGGMAGYGIGWGLWEVVDTFFLTYVFSQELFDKVVQAYQNKAFLVVLTAAFTPIPYKIITIAAGVTKINFLTLVLASAIGRSSRFFLVAGLLRYFGPVMKEKIEKYFDWLALAFFALLIGGFLLVKYLL